jgi:outer membrane protein
MKITAPNLSRIALGAALAASLLACNKTKPADKTAAAPTPGKESIVYINQDTLLSKYDYAKDVNKSIQDKGKAAQTDVQSRGQAFQREYADYQKTVNTMPADQRQTTEQRLQREQQDLQSYQQNAAAQFQNEQSTQAGKVYDKIADFRQGVCEGERLQISVDVLKSQPDDFIWRSKP